MSSSSDNTTLLSLCGKLAEGGNKVLNVCINVVLTIVFLFGVYALYDTWAIFQGAGVSDALLKYKPATAAAGENPSIQELAELYPDVRAWLTIDDTNIDYPVVQGEDNLTYVNTDIDGNFSLSGEIFLDYQNSADIMDDYNILYGHHMELSAMFGDLDLFLEDGFLDEHYTGTLYLPERTDSIEIFAVLVVDAYDTQVFSPIADDDQEKAALLAYIEENAVEQRETTISDTDRIIAFSTCSSVGTNARTVVFAKLTIMEE